MSFLCCGSQTWWRWKSSCELSVASQRRVGHPTERAAFWDAPLSWNDAGSKVASTFFLNIPSLGIPIKDSASDNYHISFESRVSDVCGVGQHWYQQHLKTYVRIFLPSLFREIMKIGLSQKILTHSLKYMHRIFELRKALIKVNSNS